jgi:hypothetical protein
MLRQKWPKWRADPNRWNIERCPPGIGWTLTTDDPTSSNGNFAGSDRRSRISIGTAVALPIASSWRQAVDGNEI